MSLTPEEITRGLIAAGVPREKAEAMALRQTQARPLREVFAEALAAESAPITLRIPWSALVSDNAMYVTDKKTGRRFKTPEYLEARKRLRALAVDAMQTREPLDCPLAVIGRFWLPNNHRRDIINFPAALADSLKGSVFTDDHWLHDVRWIRAGVDVDAPRCELVITPI